MNDKELEFNTRVLDLLESTGLNWTVKKEALISEKDGKKTNSFGLFRSDTGSHLGTVKGRYEVYQNHQLAEALLEATEGTGMTVTRGGMLHGGGKVYLQAELPEVYIGKSDMKRWITGLNAHDTTQQTAFGSTNTVVVCENTYYMAYGALSKFRHTESAKERILEFVKGLRLALGLEEKQVTIMKAMASMKLNEEIFNRVMSGVFDVTADQTVKETSTRKKNELVKVADAIETEIKLEGDTLWGLFNGITRYTNHVAPKEGKRDEYIMAGAGYDMNFAAFKLIENYLLEKKMISPEMVTV